MNINLRRVKLNVIWVVLTTIVFTTALPVWANESCAKFLSRPKPKQSRSGIGGNHPPESMDDVLKEEEARAAEAKEIAKQIEYVDREIANGRMPDFESLSGKSFNDYRTLGDPNVGGYTLNMELGPGYTIDEFNRLAKATPAEAADIITGAYQRMKFEYVSHGNGDYSRMLHGKTVRVDNQLGLIRNLVGDLQAIGAKGHVIDFGAGRLFFAAELVGLHESFHGAPYLSGSMRADGKPFPGTGRAPWRTLGVEEYQGTPLSSRPTVTAITVGLSGQGIANQKLLMDSGRAQVFAGRKLEEIPIAELVAKFGLADIVVDVRGIFRYSPDKSKVIEMLCQLIKPGGRLYARGELGLGTYIIDGKELSIGDFLVERGLFYKIPRDWEAKFYLGKYDERYPWLTKAEQAQNPMEDIAVWVRRDSPKPDLSDFKQKGPLRSSPNGGVGATYEKVR